MFFKEVRDKNKTPGKVYVYYMLVRSFRDEEGASRDKVLLNVGKLPYSREELRWLARRIEEILTGQVALQSGLPEELEATAHELATRVLERQLKFVKPAEDDPPEILSFDPRQIRAEDARSIAGEQILASVAREESFTEAFRQVGFGKKQSWVATALAVGRALRPLPLVELVDWLVRQSGVDEVLGVPLNTLTPQDAQRTARKLARHREAICRALAGRQTSPGHQERILLDFRHCVSHPSGSSWLFGLQLDPASRPEIPLFVKLGGKNGTRAVRTALELHVRPNGTRPLLLVLDSRCRQLQELSTNFGFDYLVLSRPAAQVASVLQTEDGANWHPRDGEWFLVGNAASSGHRPAPAAQQPLESDHVLLRTNLPDADLENLRSVLVSLAEVERDLLAVQIRDSRDGSSLSLPFEAELFLSFLALRLVRALALRLRGVKLPHSWQTLRELFAAQTRVTLRLPDPFGNHTHYIRTTTQPGQDLARLYEQLRLKSDLLGTRHFTV